MTTAAGEALLRWAEVDLGALEHNAKRIRALLAPQTRLMAMVKANGYGHGLLHAAEGAVRGGATWLGVYTVDEALALRAAGFQLPILVVGVVEASSLAALVVADVDVAVVDPGDLENVVAAGETHGRRPRVHVKVDTGLNRLGHRHDEAAAIVPALRGARDRIDVAGIFTHFADADGPDPAFTSEQHARFLAAVDVLRDDAPDALLHCAGSAAILRMPETHHDLVRLGIALYGYAPPNCEAPPLHVAMSLFARVVQVKTVPAGDSVGYGRIWRAPEARRIATVALGYGQGLRRALSNVGTVVIHGVRCPLVGRVSMDQIGVDVSGVDGVVRGDEALLFGRRGGARLGADEVAGLLETVPHEVLCSVPADLARVVVDAAPSLTTHAEPATLHRK